MSHRWCITLLISAALFAPVTQAAPRFGVGGGVTSEIQGEQTPVFNVSWLGHARHPWEFSAGYLGRRDRLDSGSIPSTVFAAVSKRLTWHRWFFSGGVALVDEDNEILSGHGQFYTGAGYEVGSWAVSLRHLSNADTGGRNRGETFALVEYRW